MGRSGNIIQLQGGFAGGEIVTAVVPMSRRRSVGLTIVHGAESNQASEIVGSELLVNGGFDADTDWTKGTNVTIAGGHLIIPATAGAIPAQQSAGIVAGTTYRCSIDVAVYNAGAIKMKPGNAGALSAEINSTGVHTEDLLAAGNAVFYITRPTSGDMEVDSASCKEVTTLELAPPHWQLAIYAGESVDGPWDDEPRFGPIQLGTTDLVGSVADGGAAIGNETIDLVDASGFSVGDIILLSRGTQGQQVRTVLGKASNTLTLDQRLTAAVADQATVIMLQSYSLTLPQRSAPAYKVAMLNLDTSDLGSVVMGTAVYDEGIVMS